MARKGSRVIAESASDTDWKREPEPFVRSAPPKWEPEVWIREPSPGRGGTSRTNRRTGATERSVPPDRRAAYGQRSLPDDVNEELGRLVDARLAPRLGSRLAEAAHAYERGRYGDALRMVQSVARQASKSAAVKELHGLILYQLGQWRPALKELSDYHRLTASTDQYPVVADCHRALRHYDQVEEIWSELRRDSAPAEVVAEARLVVAGARADQGDLSGAISLFSSLRWDLRRPRPHHLRQWYALADLYERSGEIPKARDLFARIVKFDAQFFDTAERLATLH